MLLSLGLGLLKCVIYLLLILIDSVMMSRLAPSDFFWESDRNLSRPSVCIWPLLLALLVDAGAPCLHCITLLALRFLVLLLYFSSDPSYLCIPSLISLLMSRVHLGLGRSKGRRHLGSVQLIKARLYVRREPKREVLLVSFQCNCFVRFRLWLQRHFVLFLQLLRLHLFRTWAARNRQKCSTNLSGHFCRCLLLF